MIELTFFLIVASLVFALVFSLGKLCLDEYMNRPHKEQNDDAKTVYKNLMALNRLYK